MTDQEALIAERNWLADLLEAGDQAEVTDRGFHVTGSGSRASTGAELVYERGGRRYELIINETS